MSFNNPNINILFNKLRLSFPNLMNINESKEFENIKYIYKTKNSNKWFAKKENNDYKIFLFGKIKEDNPQSPLITLTFDKTSAYSKDCSGIIYEKNVYIDVDYFIKNYPNFRTSLNKTTINVLINGYSNSINVIKLGEYIDDIDMLIHNLDILLNELDEFIHIEETKPEITNKNNKTCEICGKKLKKEKQKLCKKCVKKRRAANILVNLLKHVEPQTPFEKNDLNNIYQKEIEIDDCIWSLEEFNLLNKKNNEYCLVTAEKLNKFIAKYGTTDKVPVEKEEKKEPPKKLNKKCSICKKTLSTSKFYKSKKTEDGFEEYCKNCKNYVNAANYLKDLLNHVSPGSEFKVNDLENNFKKPLELKGRLWELQNFDLLVYNSDEEIYQVSDLETCQKFLDEYYIQGSITIKAENKKEDDVKKLTKQQQMDIIIKSIKEGKTDKEAAEIAGINLYKITHWFNEGKNESSEEYINFYNCYIKSKREAELNSFENFCVIESFNAKDDLTIADTLRKQQMENVLKEIRSGSSLKTAAYKSNITYQTLQNWYAYGKQNYQKEYIEFYEKINILRSPIDTPKIDDTVKKENTDNITNEAKSELNIPSRCLHILDPLPYKFRKLFIHSITESGFAWVRKDKNSWRYDRKEKYSHVSINKENIYELYCEVKKRNQIWGMINKDKAIEILKKSDIPSNLKDDIPEETYKNLNIPQKYKSILDPLPHKFKQIFKRTKKNKSGFAWVRKDKKGWRYERQQKDNRIAITRQNIYELYMEVKKKKLPWGVHDLEKAKIALSQCKKPQITENTLMTSEFEEDYLFEHILDPIPQEYLKRFKKPSSSGLAWVNNINNTWGYANPKDNIHIYDNNIYNLYLKVKKQNLPWGVRDLEKAKATLSQCEKPIIQLKSETNEEINKLETNEINCICFEKNDNVKIIITGFIKNDTFLNTLYKFKSYEKNIKKIISDRHTESTELFIELELEKNRLNTFKDRIKNYGWKIIN